MFGPQLSSHSSSAKQKAEPVARGTDCFAKRRGWDYENSERKPLIVFIAWNIFPKQNWDLDATKYLQMFQKTSQENGSLVADLTCSGTPRQTDGFAAIALLSSPLLQLKWCWVTWKTQQILRNNQSFLGRSHAPARRDQSRLSTVLCPTPQMIITIPLSWFSHKHKYHISELSVEAVCLGRSPKAGLALLLYSPTPLCF